MTRRLLHLSGALFVALTAALSGCNSIRSHRNTDPYVVRHHTWWNFYQRGRLHLRDGNHAEARRDFETALGRVPGARYPYARDRWRVRTYGMHMLEGYFPHRELGICMLEMNEPNAALNLLETSMDMEPSARAKFYINRIHEQLAEAAAPPPRIEIAMLPDWTSQRAFTLNGAVQGSNRIAHLAINGEPEFIELATQRILFQKTLQLQEGSNLIHVVAEDVAGKQTETNLVLAADWTPPQIHLRRNGLELAISCQDNLGLHQLRINGDTVSPAGNEHAIDWPIIPDHPLRLEAVDHAGNQTDWSLSEKELLHLARNKKAEPPRIHLDNAGKTLVLFNPEYELDIRAEDDTALRAIELNGNNLLSRTTPLFRTMRRVPLAPGTNHLVLAARDFDGNRIEEQVTVIYREPAYLDGIYRLTTLLSPLSGEIPDAALAQRIERLIGDELTVEPVRFYLLANENEARQLQNEQAFSESTLSDPRAMLDKGRKLDADLVFITRVLSDAPGQTVYTSVLDAHSGEELFIEDIYVEDPLLLPSQLGGLVMKIEQRFPLIQGSLGKSGKRLSIDAGEKRGAKKGMRLLVIRSDGPFEQGRVVHNGTRPAELVVSEVESNSAKVIIPSGQPKDSVQPGDYVFSR